MSNIVGNYFRLGPLTETRALPCAPPRAPTRPADAGETGSESGNPREGDKRRSVPRRGSGRLRRVPSRAPRPRGTVRGCPRAAVPLSLIVAVSWALPGPTGTATARTSSAAGGRGGPAAPQDGGRRGARGGRFGHAVGRCVRLRPESSRGPYRHRVHATRRRPGGWATAVLGLRTIRPHGRSCARAGRSPRVRGRGGRALPGRARRSVPGRARRRDRRRHLARPGPAAGRRRRGR